MKILGFPHLYHLLKSIPNQNGNFSFFKFRPSKRKNQQHFSTWMTLIGRLVSFANCSRSILEGFGLSSKAFFKTSNCLGLIVVLGPLRLPLGPMKASSSALASEIFSSIVSSPSIEFGVNSVNSSPRSRCISVKPPISEKDSY